MASLAKDAKAPLILAGGGARAANTEIMALAERLNAPVITTINGRGILPSTHPLALNITASGDHARALIWFWHLVQNLARRTTTFSRTGA